MHTRLPARSARVQCSFDSVTIRPPAASAAANLRAPVAGHRHVHVHRVAQRLRGVELLHPDGRAVAERVDDVVVGERRVAEDRRPERLVDLVGLRGDGELDLLDRRPVGCCAAGPRDGRDRARKLDVLRFEPPHVAGQPYRQPRAGDGEDGSRAIDAWRRRRSPRRGAPPPPSSRRGTLPSRRRGAPPSRRRHRPPGTPSSRPRSSQPSPPPSPTRRRRRLRATSPHPRRAHHRAQSDDMPARRLPAPPRTARARRPATRLRPARGATRRCR